jgi:hypothetical protein
MLETPDTKSRYFSVKFSSIIGGTRYVPSVCYRVTVNVQAAVEKMVQEGNARLYLKEVRFINGTPFPVKKDETPETPVQPSSGSIPQSEIGRAGKPESRVRSGIPGAGKTVQKGREFD